MQMMIIYVGTGFAIIMGLFIIIAVLLGIKDVLIDLIEQMKTRLKEKDYFIFALLLLVLSIILFALFIAAMILFKLIFYL